METIDKNEFDRLTKRVEILEQKIQYLGRLLAQIGENIAADGPSEAPKSGKVCNEALPAETKAPLSAEPFRAVAPAIEHREEREINLTPAGSEPKMEEAMTLQDDNSLAAGLDEFKQKYDSGSVDFHLNLDIARDLVKDLKRYPEWNQVPDSVKASLYLEEAYDNIIFYADCVPVHDEFYYFVAPAEPDTRYTQRDLIRRALPFFFDISYSPDLSGRLIKLIQPAVFMLDGKGGYVLKAKGKLVVEK